MATPLSLRDGKGTGVATARSDPGEGAFADAHFRPTLRSLLRSSSFRLALVYMALFGASVCLLLGFIYWSTAVYMGNQTDQTIEAEIQGLAERYRMGGLSGLRDSIAQRIARDPQGASLYLLADPDYHPIIGNLDQWPVPPDRKSKWLSFTLSSRVGRNGELETHAARARQFLLSGGYHLLVGRDVHELENTKSLIVTTLAWGLAMTVVLALVGGAMMSRSILRRIDLINQTSREIMSGDLDRRIPVTGAGDDFDQLIGNLNRMLDQIQSLMEDVRQVSDNIAHDLRTPLARLRQQLEAMRADEALAEAQRTRAEAALTEADALLATFNALLRIARIEAGDRRAGFARLDMAEVLADVCELYEPLAEERSQTLTFDVLGVDSDRGARLNGDRDLLFQACANLVDNAIKHTPAGGRVRVTLDAVGRDFVRIEVADTGPGIPAEARANVLKRFFRLEHSRSTPGNGLGLSLVSGVIKLHGGSLSLGDAAPERTGAPGLLVSVVLPRRPALV